MIYRVMTDSQCCTVEINTAWESNNPPIKYFKKINFASLSNLKKKDINSMQAKTTSSYTSC